jgi:membrane-associated phospholipid phosphatase
VTLPMVLLVSLVPLYIVIAEGMPRRPLHAPATALDHAIPFQPSWGLVYGALYLVLIVLPILVVRQPEHIDRTVSAYLFIWLAAYACFLLYPTMAPRPSSVEGRGFALWGLRILYDADPPYNCFPSLHVAHSFVSAWACGRVNRGVGRAATAAAALVAISVVCAKQHYVLDVAAGILLACVAHVLFLGRSSRGAVPESERRVAPIFALATCGLAVAVVAGFWVAYLVSGS